MEQVGALALWSKCLKEVSKSPVFGRFIPIRKQKSLQRLGEPGACANLTTVSAVNLEKPHQKVSRNWARHGPGMGPQAKVPSTSTASQKPPAKPEFFANDGFLTPSLKPDTEQILKKKTNPVAFSSEVLSGFHRTLERD